LRQGQVKTQDLVEVEHLKKTGEKNNVQARQAAQASSVAGGNQASTK
jgi:hypothetical protein